MLFQNVYLPPKKLNQYSGGEKGDDLSRRISRGMIIFIVNAAHIEPSARRSTAGENFCYPTHDRRDHLCLCALKDARSCSTYEQRSETWLEIMPLVLLLADKFSFSAAFDLIARRRLGLLSIMQRRGKKETLSFTSTTRDSRRCPGKCCHCGEIVSPPGGG